MGDDSWARLSPGELIDLAKHISIHVVTRRPLNEIIDCLNVRRGLISNELCTADGEIMDDCRLARIAHQSANPGEGGCKLVVFRDVDSWVFGWHQTSR